MFVSKFKSMNSQDKINKIDHCVAVISGKGGVGKSTIAANLALAYAGQGLNTGLLDADIWCPSIPILFGLENYHAEVVALNRKSVIIPAEKFGVKILSMGFISTPEQNIKLTGLEASKALLQLYFDTQWGELDVMIIDMPSGAGDLLTVLTKEIKPNKSIVVTTPQKLSTVDAQKIGTIFNSPSVNLPITGVVENMSWFTPMDYPNEKYPLFGNGGGIYLADFLNTDLLAQIPLAQGLAESADHGKLLTYAQNSITIPLFHKLAFDVLGED